jgi:hypothetical protein
MSKWPKLWARRFYDPGGRELARSRARWDPISARRRRVADTIAGAPEPPVGIAPVVASQERAAREPARDE